LQPFAGGRSRAEGHIAAEPDSLWLVCVLGFAATGRDCPRGGTTPMWRSGEFAQIVTFGPGVGRPCGVIMSASSEGILVMASQSMGLAQVEFTLPSGPVLLAIAPLVLLYLGLVAFSLVDLIRAPSVRYLPKAVWALIIVLVGTGLGAIGYLVFGRTHGPAIGANHDRTGDQQRDPGQPPDSSESAQVGDAVSSSIPTATRTFTTRTEAAAVETYGLTRDYGGGGLFDVDLLVPRGSIYGLVGPNGAGKTTMLSILAGMRRADRGVVRVALPRNAIAVCPDVPEFDGWLTAAEVVDLARGLVGAAPAENVIGDALRSAGLTDVADRAVGEFSRGMTQRLGLACALVGDPQLLILDEPTSALDPAGRAEMLDLVSSMRGHRTVIFSSHILADVQRVADQVGILRQGRLLYQGPTQALIDTHLRPRWLVRIAGDTTLLRAELGTQPWVTGIVPVEPGGIRIDATSMEAGERGIPLALAACGERLISCEPVAADLESAFLALTTAR
jgi:ABC-2 type transport system ATP-binding protein